MNQKILTKQLSGIRRSCIFRRAAMLLGGCLLLPGFFCWLLEVWNHLWGLQESRAALGIIAVFVLSLACGIYYFCRELFRFRGRGLLLLAKEVEKRHPELQDAYIGAVELEGKPLPLRPMEHYLLEQMQRRFGGDEKFLPEVFAIRLSWRKTAVCFLGAVCVWLVSICFGNVSPKVFYHCSDLLKGSESGLRIHEIRKEYPVHSDVRIAADILRWEKKARIEIRNGAGKREILPMTDSPEGTSFFTFYNLTENCSFRICTPSLRSGWRSLAVYTPPAAEEIRLTAVPPAYTRQKKSVWTALRDLELMEGSSMELQVKTLPGVTAELTDGMGTGTSAASPHVFRKIIRRSEEISLALRDKAGHEVRLPAFRVTALPDLPPVVEVRNPGADTKVRRGDSVRLEFFAGDDFGISEARLRFSVSGVGRKRICLFQAEKGKEQPEEEVLWRWDLPEYDVKDGDLLSCFIEVADNREPEPQWSRSDIFFLTVRPREDMLEEEKGQGQNSGQKFDISGLIAENKRLMRLSLDSIGAEQKDRQRNSFELHRGLKELSLEVRRRMNEFVKMSMGHPQPGLPELFQDASRELIKAARLVENMLFEESLQPEELSLTSLIRIENELVKNSMRSSQGENGEKSEQQKQQGEQQKQQKQQEPGQSLEEQLALMKKLLTRLRELSGDQRRYNDSCQKREAMPAGLARRQQRLLERAEQIGRALKELPPASRSAAHLEAGAQEMRQGMQAMREERPDAGEIHGVRALRNLENAVRSLEKAVRKAAANQVEQLADTAGRLAEQQEKEGRDSAASDGKADASAAGRKRERQKQLSAMTGALKQEIQQTASLLEKDFPEVSAEMRKRLAESSRRGLEKMQKRAENGLLYRRFNAAGKAQMQAANLLRSLAQGLHESGGKMPPVSGDELRDALEQLQRHGDRIAEEMERQNSREAQQRIQQQMKSAGEMLQRFGEALRDGQLMELSEMLQMPDGASTSAGAGARALELLKASAGILLQHLQKMELGEKQRLNRNQMLPPEKYRRQVQEYFKNLGEEK